MTGAISMRLNLGRFSRNKILIGIVLTALLIVTSKIVMLIHWTDGPFPNGAEVLFVPGNVSTLRLRPQGWLRSGSLLEMDQRDDGKIDLFLQTVSPLRRESLPKAADILSAERKLLGKTHWWCVSPDGKWILCGYDTSKKSFRKCRFVAVRTDGSCSRSWTCAPSALFDFTWLSNSHAWICTEAKKSHQGIQSFSVDSQESDRSAPVDVTLDVRSIVGVSSNQEVCLANRDYTEFYVVSLNPQQTVVRTIVAKPFGNYYIEEIFVSDDFSKVILTTSKPLIRHENFIEEKFKALLPKRHEPNTEITFWRSDINGNGMRALGSVRVYSARLFPWISGDDADVADAYAIYGWYPGCKDALILCNQRLWRVPID